MNDLMQIGDTEAAQQKFTELGRIISEVSRQNRDSVLELVDAVSDGFDAVSNEVLQHDALAGTKIFAEDMRSSVTSVVSLFSGVTGAASSAFASLTESAQKAAEHLNEFEMPKQGRAPAAKEEEEKDSKLQKLFKKEGKAAASKFQGFARKLKIPLPGGVAAGGVGIMALGFLDEDRVRAEAGELKNVLESAYDAGIGNVLAKAVAADSKLQESLQNNYGISRKELQAVEAQFVRGGVGILQMGKKIGKQFAEDIPNTITTSALALDLMFNLGAGATAGTAVSYMHNYAMGLEESIGFIEKLSLSEAAHSLGAATLLKNIEDAASALSDYGFGIEGVADYAIQLQTVFEDMDVPDKYAGRMVGKGLTQISKGLSSMSDNWKMLIGERMSGQEGLDAIQWFEEAYTRVKREGSTQEYKDLVAAMYEIAHNATEGNEAQTYMMLSRTMGLGNLGATMTMKIGELNLAGNESGALEATSEGKEVLKKAFQTKKEEKSQFQIQLNKWLKGLAKVGQGLISMVGKTLASLILYVRGWFYMIESIVSWDPERTQRIKEQVAAHAMDYTEDYILMAKGYVEMKNAGADVGAAFKNIVTALTTDVSGRDRRSNHGAGGGASGGWGTGSSATSSAPRGAVQADRSQPATKMQVVYIPTGFGSSGGSGFSGGESSREYDAGLSKKSARKSRRYAAKQGQSWAGGGLVLRSEGVSANGDIMMTVGGNCPRCGYIFGGGSVSSTKAASSSSFKYDDDYTTFDAGELTRIREGRGKGILKPSKDSRGVAISHGYNLGTRGKRSEILQELNRAGLSSDQIGVLESAIGMRGEEDINKWLQKNKNKVKLTEEQNAKLYGIVFPKYGKAAKFRATHANKKGGSKLSGGEYNELVPEVKDFLTDLTYVGAPYAGKRREQVNTVLKENRGNPVGQLQGLRGFTENLGEKYQKRGGRNKRLKYLDTNISKYRKRT